MEAALVMPRSRCLPCRPRAPRSAAHHPARDAVALSPRPTAHASKRRTGRLDEALVALDDAMAANREGADGHGWYAPELLRIKGEVLLQQAADQSTLAAEDCFDQAAQMARAQGALFWELRIALSVARLRASQGRRHEARALLVSVYDRFTEGFATADLQAARTMLDELPP